VSKNNTERANRMAKRRNKQGLPRNKEWTQLEPKDVRLIEPLLSDISLKLHPKAPMTVPSNQCTKYGTTGIEKPHIVVRKL
jgi:hypothetical protein